MSNETTLTPIQSSQPAGPAAKTLRSADDDDANVEQSFGLGHTSMTDRIGGFFRPKLAEEVCILSFKAL